MKATVGAVCFVLHDQQVLLIQRKLGAFLGKYDGAGGHVEFGETPAETALRELAEETGLQAASCELRAQLLLYDLESGRVVSSYLFVSDQWSGELTGSEEGQPEWVPLDRLPHTNLIDFMQITLPLVLTPGSMLVGTIRHTPSGAPISYDLQHFTLSGVRSLRRQAEVRV